MFNKQTESQWDAAECCDKMMMMMMMIMMMCIGVPLN